jgi:hypothetical protein
MSWEHAAEARAALSAIVNDPEHGAAALSSAQTLSNLLKDLLPDAPREKSILVAAAEAGLAETLRQHVDRGMDPDTAIRLTASQFSSTTQFTPEACSWAAGEFAAALGISHGGGAGAGHAGATPSGFDPQQGMPTQIAPIPRPGYAPGQQPVQGFGQTPGASGGVGEGAAATTPGPWQAGAYGQPGGGYGTGQPGGAGWQGGGYGQPGGYGIQQPGGYGPRAPAGPMGPIMPGGPGGPVKPRDNRRGWLIGGGILAAVIIAAVVATSLTGGKNGNTSDNGGGGGGGTHKHSVTPTPTPTPTPSPTPIHQPGTDALVTIMNPIGSGASPVGTDCVTAKLFGLNAATLDAKAFCAHTTAANIVVWGYQFDSSADYQAGLAHINHYVGFDKVTPGSTCPPPSGSIEGKIGWHANHNPKYVSRSGQDIECLTDGQKPVLIWTMPTQDVFFIGQDNVKGTSINTVIKWWETLTYGP